MNSKIAYVNINVKIINDFDIFGVKNMIKRLIAGILMATAVFWVSGCSYLNIKEVKSETENTYKFLRTDNDEIIIDSSDDADEIYRNYKEYTDEIIYIDGKYECYVLNGTQYHFVLKDEENENGNTVSYGFEVKFSGDYPKEGTNVSAKGYIEVYDEDSREVIRLKLSELNKN